MFNDTTNTSKIIYDKNAVPEMSADWHTIDSISIGDTNFYGNRFRFNFLAGSVSQHYPMITMIRLETVRLVDYLHLTTHFDIPKPATTDINYTSYMYIGTENNFKDRI